MTTVLFVSPMTLGDELQVREIHERLPISALDEGIGVKRLVAFIGSGIYALEITVGDGDFQEQFHRFLAHPAVRDLFLALQPYVESLPAAEQGTADMPLASVMMVWPRDGMEPWNGGLPNR